MNTADPRAARNGLRLGPRFMVRVSGLPYDAVEALRQPASMRWATDLNDTRGRLREGSERLSDSLAAVIGGTDDVTLRRQLIHVRRRIFNGDLPPQVQEVADRLGGQTGADLRAWTALHGRLRDLLDDPVVDNELASAQASLRRLAQQPRLRQGLLLASSTLDQQLDSYLEAGPGKLSKKHRRIERSILEYVYRCACKTSPFSSFTGVALGEFLSGADLPAAFATTVDEEWVDHTQLNISVLGRVGEWIVATEQLRSDLPVALVSGWRTDAERIRYLRRTITSASTEGSVSFDSVSEVPFFLRHGNGIEALIALCRGEESVRYGVLLKMFAERVRVPVADCDRFLTTLLRLGLLDVPCLAVDIHSSDPVRALADSLEGLDRPWAGDIAKDLRRVSALVAEYRCATVPGRRRVLRDIQEVLATLKVPTGTEDLDLPQTLVYEDTRAKSSSVLLDREEFERRVGDDLLSLTRVMPAFDGALLHRLTFRGFFLARYGRGGQCSDLLGLVSDFQEDVYDYYLKVSAGRKQFSADGSYIPATNWLRQPEVTAIDAARVEFADRMRALWEGTADGTEEVELETSLIDAVARHLAETPQGFVSMTHFLQLSAAPGESAAVLNQSWGGLFFPFSRFAHGFQELGLPGRLRQWQRTLSPPGAIFAEITGGTARTNLNLHPRLTDYEIVCPGEYSRAPQPAQIPLDDLVLQHDAESDRLVLRSKALSCEVVPIYLGYLVPSALPEVARTLLLLSPMANVVLDLWGGVPEGPARDGVRARPRVRYGGVVIARRTWSAPPKVLPLRDPNTSTGAWFAAWQEWRSGHQLGEQVFVTLHHGSTGTGEGSEPDTAGPGPRRQKPHYLDFASVLSLQAFERLLTASVQSVDFTEMLPDASGLHTTTKAGSHITEITAETLTATPTTCEEQ